MLFRMRLYHEPFAKIKAGTKTIEMRLNDEKRSQVQAGDEIEFTDLSDGEKLVCTVKNVYKYPSFHELYQHHSKESIGYDDGENAEPADMLEIYSEENIRKYGVVGIEVEAVL